MFINVDLLIYYRVKDTKVQSIHMQVHWEFCVLHVTDFDIMYFVDFTVQHLI